MGEKQWQSKPVNLQGRYLVKRGQVWSGLRKHGLSQCLPWREILDTHAQ